MAQNVNVGFIRETDPNVAGSAPEQLVGNRVRLEDGDGNLIGASSWAPEMVSDVAANDIDKTFTVTANEVWHILGIRVHLTTTATVGNRQLEIQFISGGVVFFDVRPDLVQAASLAREYNFGPSMADGDAFRDTDWVSTPIPPTLVLAAGMQIRVLENNSVDASDDMLVYILTGQRSAS